MTFATTSPTFHATDNSLDQNTAVSDDVEIDVGQPDKMGSQGTDPRKAHQRGVSSRRMETSCIYKMPGAMISSRTAVGGVHPAKPSPVIAGLGGRVKTVPGGPGKPDGIPRGDSRQRVLFPEGGTTRRIS